MGMSAVGQFVVVMFRYVQINQNLNAVRKKHQRRVVMNAVLPVMPRGLGVAKQVRFVVKNAVRSVMLRGQVVAKEGSFVGENAVVKMKVVLMVDV